MDDSRKLRSFLKDWWLTILMAPLSVVLLYYAVTTSFDYRRRVAAWEQRQSDCLLSWMEKGNSLCRARNICSLKTKDADPRGWCREGGN